MRFKLCFALLLACGIGAAQNSHWARTYDLKHVSWRVSLHPETHTFDGDTTQTLRPLSPGLKTVDFDFGQMSISKITVNGALATFKRDGSKISVALDRPASSREDLKVRILYAGHPDAGLYFVDAVDAYPSKTPMVYTQGEMEDNRYWLPVYDYPDDKATSEGTIEVPNGWFALSNGALVETKDVKGRKAYHWKCDQPHVTYLISLVAGPYVEGRETWDNIPVSYYVPPGLEAMGKTSFGGTDKMVRFYSELTGVRYPYAKFAQTVVGDFMFGGMENISAVTQTIGCLHDPKEFPLANAEGLVLHELAHQWFGDYATCINWSHIWLNEGFASFLPNFFVRKAHGEEAYDIDRFHMLEGAYGAAVNSKRPMVSTDYEKPMDMFDGNAYGGGAARMFMLLDKLGEQVFWKGVNAYLKKYGMANATTEDFFEVMKQSSGKDLEAFRKQWFYQAGAPKITLTRVTGGIRVAIETGSYDLDTPVWVLDGDRWSTQTVSIKGKEARLPMGDLDKRPVLLDPNVFLMAEIKYDLGYTSDDWVAIYRHAPNSGQKLRLLGQMQTAGKTDLIDLLAKEEKSFAVLREMVPRLGAVSSDLVLSLSRSSDRLLMAESVSRLGRLPKTDAIIARLRDVHKNDKSDMMRRRALDGLMALTNDEALVSEAWDQDSDWDTMRQFALNWWAQNKPDLAREKCLAVLAHPGTSPLRNSAIGHLGGLKDKPGEHEVFEALMAVLKGDSFGPRMSAIYALAAYGNAEALPELKKLAEHPQFFLRDAAKSAVGRLEKK